MANAIQIDAHQHYWNPARGDYGWMPEDDPILSRPYGPADLSQSLASCEVKQTIIVQAAPSVAETEYMLGIADTTPSVAAVVGWIDFERPEQIETLRRLASHPKFVGVRPMIQDLPDVDWMLRDDVQWAFEAIVDLDLTFDALGFPQHAANFHTIFCRYPNMRAVIDHCLKPQIRNQSSELFQSWAADISRIANETQAFCKLSGVVTEANANWTQEDLKPYTDHILDAFTADRVMWGSDWPVVRLRGEYEDWYQAARALTSHKSAAEHASIFGGTAQRFYRLSESSEEQS
ncbi:MAG: amidohydrolase family protein [Pseudomonadota bacterium]